jgi:hypothetical protein
VQPTNKKSFLQDSEEHIVQALNWLAHRLAWEYRLAELRRGGPSDARPTEVPKAA